MIYKGEELINSCKELAGDNKQILFIGEVEHEKLGPWLLASDFFISTSFYEGNGVAALEAMSCGCIPILTDIFSFRKMTGPGHCGFLFKPGDAESLCTALSHAIKSDLKTEREKTLLQFNQEHSFEAITGKINNVINGLINA